MSADRTTARRILAEQLRGRIDPSQIDAATALDDLGIDSFRFLVIVLAIEAAVGRKVYSISQLARIKTVSDLLEPLGAES